MSEPDALEHGSDALGLGFARNSALLEPEANIVGHRQMGKERIVLKHQADVALVCRQSCQVLAAQGDAARAGLQEARDEAERRGLAAARGAEQGHEFTLADIE